MIKQSPQPNLRSPRGLRVAFVAGVLVAAVLAMAGCTAGPQSTTPQSTAPQSTTPPSGGSAGSSAPSLGATSAVPGDASQGVTGLQIKDLQVGTGPKAELGNTLTVNYTGWLMDGTKFDSSLDGGEPFKFVLGKGEVIQGWDKGLVGMQVGGKRQLIIPPEMGYGAQGSGTIPPNATLKFEVELLRIDTVLM